MVINYTAKSNHDKPWTCINCDTVNQAEFLDCVNCMTRRRGVGRLTIHELEKHQTIIKRPSLANDMMSKVKKIFKPRPSWSCPQCTLLVCGQYTECEACGAQMPPSHMEKTPNTAADTQKEVGSLSRKNVSDSQVNLPCRAFEESYDIISPSECADRDLPKNHSSPSPPPASVPLQDQDFSDSYCSPIGLEGTGKAISPMPTSSSAPPSLQPSPTHRHDRAPPVHTHWVCSLCGAFNFIMKSGQRCYICNIGLHQAMEHSMDHQLTSAQLTSTAQQEHRVNHHPCGDASKQELHNPPYPNSYEYPYPGSTFHRDAQPSLPKIHPIPNITGVPQKQNTAPLQSAPSHGRGPSLDISNTSLSLNTQLLPHPNSTPSHNITLPYNSSDLSQGQRYINSSQANLSGGQRYSVTSHSQNSISQQQGQPYHSNFSQNQVSRGHGEVDGSGLQGTIQSNILQQQEPRKSRRGEDRRGRGPHSNTVPAVPDKTDPAYYSKTNVPMTPEHILRPTQLFPAGQLQHKSPQQSKADKAKAHHRQNSDVGLCSPLDSGSCVGAKPTQPVQAIRREDSMEANEHYIQVQQYCRQVSIG